MLNAITIALALVFVHLPANRNGISRVITAASKSMLIRRLLLVSLPFFLLNSYCSSLSTAMSRACPIGLHKRYQQRRFFQVDSAVGGSIFQSVAGLAGESVTVAVGSLSVGAESFPVAVLEALSFPVAVEVEVEAEI